MTIIYSSITGFQTFAQDEQIIDPDSSASQSRPSGGWLDPASLRGLLRLWSAGLAAKRRTRQKRPRSVGGRMAFLDAALQPASPLDFAT